MRSFSIGGSFVRLKTFLFRSFMHLKMLQKSGEAAIQPHRATAGPAGIQRRLGLAFTLGRLASFLGRPNCSHFSHLSAIQAK